MDFVWILCWLYNRYLKIYLWLSFIYLWANVISQDFTIRNSIMSRNYQIWTTVRIISFKRLRVKASFAFNDVPTRYRNSSSSEQFIRNIAPRVFANHNPVKNFFGAKSKKYFAKSRNIRWNSKFESTCWIAKRKTEQATTYIHMYVVLGPGTVCLRQAELGQVWGSGSWHRHGGGASGEDVSGPSGTLPFLRNYYATRAWRNKLLLWLVARIPPPLNSVKCVKLYSRQRFLSQLFAEKTLSNSQIKNYIYVLTEANLFRLIAKRHALS
jgi:hypothetical protein